LNAGFEKEFASNWSKDSPRNDAAEAAQMPLFAPDQAMPAQGDGPAGSNNSTAKRRPTRPRMPRDEIRGIQDLVWKESLFALQRVEEFTDDSAFLDFLRHHLPQNSEITRDRYAGTILRWFFSDGVRGGSSFSNAQVSII
jgi:hypothetical protein